MRFTENENINPIFERAYKNYAADYQKRNPGKPVPTIGPGWLSKIANDTLPSSSKYCMRTYDKDGEVLICANPMWKNKGVNPYYCDACCKEKGTFETKADMPEAGKAFVNDIVIKNRKERT